jgi:hypothetical protein
MESVTAAVPRHLVSYPVRQIEHLKGVEPNSEETVKLAAIGQHLLKQEWPPQLRLLSPNNSANYQSNVSRFKAAYRRAILLSDWGDEQIGLAIATVMCMGIELTNPSVRDAPYTAAPQVSGAGSLLHRFIACRLAHEADELPDLPVPKQFRQVFQDWAAGRVNFVEFVDEQ